MNRECYRTIFCQRLGMPIAVPEIAKARRKSSGSSTRIATRGRASSPWGGKIAHGRNALIAIAVACALGSSHEVFAAPPLPTGGTVASGAASVSQQGNTLTVSQSSQNLSVNWQTFDIAADHKVEFQQPNSSSIALNRVVGTDASAIYGSLSANGKVFLVNPNGVMFAPGAQVSVGGLVASTLSLSDEDFSKGKYQFKDGANAGTVENQGSIHSDSVALIGRRVINGGEIHTPGGRTTLAAGDRVGVSVLDGLLTADVEASVLNAEIQNHGAIVAEGGQVALVAGRADAVLDSLINTDGLIRVNSVRTENGKIYLDGGAGGFVNVGGALDASSPTGAGGDVHVLGREVMLGAASTVDVSGEHSGGTALIGGDFQGKNPQVHNARRTSVEAGAVIRADGQEKGGRVIVWSDDQTRFAGEISAGGKGFAEVSGKGTLEFAGKVNTGGGTLLLDPADITVQNAAGDQVNTFSGGQLATLLASNDVVLDADNNITWDASAALDYNGIGSTGRTLTLQAGNNIAYSGSISDSVAGGDRLSVVFNADRDANGAGGINLANGASILTSGGDIVLRGGNVALAPLPLFTDGGYDNALRASAARGVKIGSATLNAGGGNIVARGAGVDGTDFGAGVSAVGSTLQTSGSGTITMDGIGGAGATYNRGVETNNANISTANGSLTLQGKGGGTGIENSGVRLDGATIETTGSGDFVINGLGSTGDAYNDGFVTQGANLRVNNGNLTITGTGRGSGFGSDGVELAVGAVVEATGSGNVTLNGASTATGPNTNRGVVVWISSITRTNTGALTLLGASADANKGNAVSVEVNSTVGDSSQSGPLSITGDTLNLDTSFVQGAGSLLLQPLTPGTSMGLGDSASGTFNLTAAELAIVKNGFSSITVGRSDGSGAVDIRNATFNDPVTIRSPSGSGSISVNGTLSTGSAGNAGSITLAAAGGISLTNGTIDTINALNLTGGSYSFAGTSTLKSDTLAFGNGNALYLNSPDVANIASLTLNQSSDTQISNALLPTSAIGGNLVKSGASTLTLTGSNSYNNTTINAGTLSAGNGGTTGNLGSGSVTNNGTLIFNRSDSVLQAGAIGGTGNVIQAGTGTTTFTGTNTYAGTTTINAGTLRVGNGGSTGSLGTGATTINAGTVLEFYRNDAPSIASSLSGSGALSFTGTGLANQSDYALSGVNSGFTGAVTIDKARLRYDNANDLGAAAPITVLSGGQLYATANVSNALNLNGSGWSESSGVLGALRLGSGVTASGNIALQSDSRIMTSGVGVSAGTISGGISGSGALETGGNDASLVLTAANTFTGALSIRNGITDINGPSVLLAPGASLATNTINIGNASSVLPAGNRRAILQNQADNQLSPNVVINFDGIGGNGRWAIWQLLGTNQSIAGINDSTGGSIIENTEAQAGYGGGTVTLTGSGNYSFAGLFRDKHASGTSPGKLGLAKVGSGTQTLSGASISHTGATTLNAGTLSLVNASSFNSATTVNSGATLELGGNVGINHAAGFSLALNDGSTLNKTSSGFNAFDASNITVSGTAAINVANSGVNNQLFIGGATTGLAGSGTINLTNTGSGTTGVTLRTGAGNFAGTLNVSNGVLNVGSGASLALQNTALNLAGTAKLNLSGAYSTTATSGSVKSLAGESTTGAVLGSQTLTLGTNNGTGADFGGVISGAGALAKTGSGIQTLSGNNTYAGTTTVSAGTLQIGNGGTSGSLGTGSVTDNGTLVFKRSDTQTIANVITGAGNLTQAGAGRTILTGNNSYGTTTVNAGTLQAGNDGTSGTFGTGVVTNNADVVINRSNSVSLSNIAGGGIAGTGNFAALIGGGFAVDRPITQNGANSTILLTAGKNIGAGTASGGDVTLSSAISTSSSGTLTIFSGNAATNLADAMVSGAAGPTRYKTYNASSGMTSGAVSGTRNYYYRQQPSLSVTGLTASKVYDGLTDATSALNTGSVVVTGTDGDSSNFASLTVNGARFDSAHAGSRGLQVDFGASSLSYSAGGANWVASGYSGASFSGATAGTISPKAITTSINGGGKTYDGLTSTSATLSAPTGFVGNDGALAVGGLSLAYDNPNAGARNIVATGTPILSNFVGRDSGNGSGVGAGNQVAGVANDYIVMAPASIGASIGKAPLTISANNDAKLIAQNDAAGYNGASFSGFVHGESPADLAGTLSISRSNAGTEASGTYTGVLTPAGYNSGNYAITYTTGNYQILPAKQLLIKVQNVTNPYGTSSDYVVTSAQYVDGSGSALHTLTEVARNGNTYTFSDGLGGSVTFTIAPQGSVVSGAGHLTVGNYALTGVNSSVQGSNFVGLNYVGNEAISAVALSPAASGVTKVYDGTVDMTGLAMRLTGLLAGDRVVGDASGTFENKNAGNGVGYSVNGISLSGQDAGNYYLSSGALSGNDGVITPRPITVTGISADSKVYDGTTAATLTTAGHVLSGVVGGDAVALDTTGSGAVFADRNVGSSKGVTVSGFALNGADAGNYLLSQPAGLAASITPRQIVVSATPDRKYFDGTTTASASPTVSGSLGAGDHFSLLGEQYHSSNIGSGIPLLPFAAIEDGNGGNNYLLTFLSDATGSIEQHPVTVAHDVAASAASDLNEPRKNAERSPEQIRVVADETKARQRDCATDGNSSDCAGYGRSIPEIVSTGIKLPSELDNPSGRASPRW